MNNIASFLATDRAKWLKAQLPKLVGQDPQLASRYLVCETFARSERLRRTGIADDVLRDDFAALRLACDDELVRMAHQRRAAFVDLVMPIEELTPATSDAPAINWPCSGKLASVRFPLTNKELELA